MIDKLMGFAKAGNGRRLLNTLKKKDVQLTDDELESILGVYRDTGLAIDVAGLKKRRGILKDHQYDALADQVRNACFAHSLDNFLSSLKDLLSCGIKMNPAKMEEDTRSGG